VRQIGRLLAAASLVVALTPAQAVAAQHKKLPPAVQQVINDCENHNYLHGHYTAAVLEQALAQLPTDVKEYTLCANEIQNAESQAVGGTQSLNATAAAQQRVAKHAPQTLSNARKQGAAPVTLGGHEIAAGAVNVTGSSFLGTLPTPLLVVLALGLALGGIPLATRVQSLVRARRSR